MKVMIVNQHISDGIGGSEMQCDIIAKGLSARGHDVIYAVVGGRSKHDYSRLPYLAEPLNLLKKDSINTFILKHNPDVVYWRFNKNYLAKSVSVFQRNSLPYVFAVSSNNDLNVFSYRSLLGNGYMQKVKILLSYCIQGVRSAYNYQAIKKASVLSSLNKSYLFKSPVKKSFAVWNAVEEDLIPFNWPRPFICWVANIKADKRPEKFIELAGHPSQKDNGVDFLMIGDIRHEVYRNLIEEANDRLDNFHLLGPKLPSEVNGILEKSLFLIHTCMPEGFGNNFIQAWMQGKPTISLEFDPDGLISSEGLGFVSGTFETMCADAKRLALDTNLREAIGQRAKIFARENFTKSRMLDQIETLLMVAIEN
jgi:glycosyltransferase involved in cell wall biosynthesis